MPVDTFVAASPARPAARTQASAQPILVPGRNCREIAQARQFAFLVDGEEYFRAVREALLEAQRSIFILGWDIDSRMRLTPGGANDGLPEPLSEFLNAVVAARCPARTEVSVVLNLSNPSPSGG